jgi:hypothetical protein
MAIDEDRVRDYLGRYAASLTTFDAQAAAELWSTPGMIADDRFSGVLDTREAMVQGLEQSYPLYRQLGLASVGYELVELRVLSSALVLVRVRWIFFDDAGAELTDTDSHYLLRDEAGTLRATVCIETDAAANLQRLADRKGVDLSPSGD